MSEDFEIAARRRDRRLRRRIINLLKFVLPVSPSGGMSGRAIVDEVSGVEPEDQRFEDDSHAITLLRELVAKKLITESDRRTHRGQRFGLDLLSYKITDLGLALWNESIPADADIDDERNLD
jgi:hypothetical protein